MLHLDHSVKSSGEESSLSDAISPTKSYLNAFLIIHYADQKIYEKYSPYFKQARFISEQNLEEDPKSLHIAEFNCTLMKFRISRTVIKIASILVIYIQKIPQLMGPLSMQSLEKFLCLSFNFFLNFLLKISL